MTTYEDKKLGEFNEKFKCIHDNCDSNGTLCEMSSSGPAPSPCRYCYEHLIPMREMFYNALDEQKEEIKKDLLAIADKYELEDLRREVTSYFEQYEQ